MCVCEKKGVDEEFRFTVLDRTSALCECNECVEEAPVLFGG